MALANLVVTVGVIGWNYYTAIFGFAGNTVGGLSDDYDTLFTPAGYAFSIWGVIFLGLLVHAIAQLRWAFGSGDHTAFFRSLGPWLLLANVANGLWVVLWLTERTAASVPVLLSMVVFLQLAVHRLDLARAPRSRAFTWHTRVPIAIYAGWVTVAVLANLSAYLAKEGVVPNDSAAWAIGMIVIATLANVAVLWRRPLREHALVGVWALVAIAVARWGSAPAVQWSAVGGAGLLAVLALWPRQPASA